MTKKKEPPVQKVEDQDFFFYNNGEDTKEALEFLGVDNQRQSRYDDNYQNESY